MEILKRGSRGSLVSMAQLALKRAGFYTGVLDGIFGIKTESSVRYFQYLNRLETDGIIAKSTWNLLEKYLRGYFRYSLKTGDTYWLLANKYGTSVKAIMLANPDINENFLRVGQIINIPFGFNVVPSDIPYSSYLTQLVIQGLLTRYPFMELAVCGKSVMGKDIYCIKTGKGPTEVFYNAAHHANEWITVPLLLKFLEQYACAYAFTGRINGEDASQLYNKTTLYTVPLVNPDGVDLVTGALASGDYYDSAVKISENYPSISFPDGWKANISGTDLNLNYPANREKAKKLKSERGFVSPAPRDYVGDAPLSAPESRAMYDFTLQHDFRLILAYHTQGKIIFGKYLDYDPPKAEEIGNVMSKKSGYTQEITPEYSSFAGYKDWFIETYNRPGYTIEAGIGENPLSLTQFDEIYRDNVGILVAGLTEVCE